QPYGARHWIQSCARTFRTNFTIAFLPSIPGLLDRVRPRAAIHIRQIEKVAEPTAARTPPLGRVVAEILRIELREGSTAPGARSFGRMNRNVPLGVQCEQNSVAEIEGLIYEFLDSTIC